MKINYRKQGKRLKETSKGTGCLKGKIKLKAYIQSTQY